jgi:hypothetical protein
MAIDVMASETPLNPISLSEKAQFESLPDTTSFPATKQINGYNSL